MSAVSRLPVARSRQAHEHNHGLELLRATEAAESSGGLTAVPGGVRVGALPVAMLARPRHQALLERVREMGARVALISDGDVDAAMMAASAGMGVDVMLGAGGTKEAVLAAC